MNAELFLLDPEVPGGTMMELPRTTLDVVNWPVATIEVCFDGWLGDALLTVFTVFLATTRLRDAIVSASLSRVEWRAVRVERSEQYADFHPEVALPEFVWLVPTGRVQVDLQSGTFSDWSGHDFATTGQYLIVSSAAMRTLKSLPLDHCEVRALRKATQ